MGGESHTLAPLPKNLDSEKVNQQMKPLIISSENLTCR